jgi:hypothetical protein
VKQPADIAKADPQKAKSVVEAVKAAPTSQAAKLVLAEVVQEASSSPSPTHPSTDSTWLYALCHKAFRFLEELEACLQREAASDVLTPEGCQHLISQCRRIIALVEPAEPAAAELTVIPTAPRVTVAQLIVQALGEAEKPLTNAEIAQALGKKQTDTFQPLKGLVAKGVVTKSADATYGLTERRCPAKVEVGA